MAVCAGHAARMEIKTNNKTSVPKIQDAWPAGQLSATEMNFVPWIWSRIGCWVCALSLVQMGPEPFTTRPALFLTWKADKSPIQYSPFVERNSVGAYPPFRRRTAADPVSKRRTVLNNTGRTKCRKSAILVQCTL